jgi:hypothetical protein
MIFGSKNNRTTEMPPNTIHKKSEISRQIKF